jgi:hypothetical protein
MSKRVIVLGITKAMRYGAPVTIPDPAELTHETWPYAEVIKVFQNLTADAVATAVIKNGWFDCCLILDRETAEAMIAGNVADEADFVPYVEEDVSASAGMLRTRKGHIDMRIEYQDEESVARAAAEMQAAVEAETVAHAKAEAEPAEAMA